MFGLLATQLAFEHCEWAAILFLSSDTTYFKPGMTPIHAPPILNVHGKQKKKKYPAAPEAKAYLSVCTHAHGSLCVLWTTIVPGRH